MFWKKKKETTLKSEEYLELKTYLDKLRLQLTTLELDLQLYVKKLRVTKGLKQEKEEKEETENNNNPVILPI